MWFFTSLSPIILMAALATSVAAQYTPQPGGTSIPGGYGPPGGEPGDQNPTDPARMGWNRAQRGDMRDLPTSAELEGPASPAIMRDTIGLTGQPAERYAKRYTNYMADTRQVRDSLKSALEALRSGMRDQDRSAVRERQSYLQEQWTDLSKQDQEFENNCKDLLTKDQQKRYKKWKDARDKAGREQGKGRKGSGAGSGW